MTDLFRVRVANLPDAGEEAVVNSHMRATQTQALADATALRKMGHSSTVSKVTLKKLPLKELLSHIFNRSDEEFVEEETVVKEVKGVKHVKSTGDADDDE